MLNYRECDNGIIIENQKNFDIAQIFGCGQAFRFDKVENGDLYCGVAYSKYIELEKKANIIEMRGISLYDFEKIFKDYFDLDTDYGEISKSFEFDPHLREAAKYSDGIRILRQEPFETLISFIISQNNNIPRIKKIIDSMSAKYGNLLCEKNGKRYFSFPDAAALVNAGESGIFELKTGFRAKYIYDAASKIYNNEINLTDVFEMSTADAVKYLMQIKGVGPKVALCTLLFGFNKKDAFPIDVWMKKVLCEHYGDGFDIAAFGKYAGVAQQYLFYYERCMNNIFA